MLAERPGEVHPGARARFVILKDTERGTGRTLLVKCEDTVEWEAMKNMADTTFRERLPDYRNQYYRLKSKAAKGRMLDRLQEAYGFERKFLNKRLTGNRPFKGRRGRGRTYGEAFEAAALAIHRASGWMCAPYLKARMAKLLPDFEQLFGPVPEPARSQLLQAGESKFARLFREHPGTHVRQGTRTSGANRIKQSVTACPGASLEDGRPGVGQLDSVAHGGGGPEPHFYSLDLTDAQTQWVEFSFAWCRGAHAVKTAFAKMTARLPFPLRKVHPDGGSEFINSVFLEFLAKGLPGVELCRSRPGRPNDNCRVEQKNGSILRPYLRDWRLDDPEQQKALDWIAENLALYTNLFVPSKKLVSKTPVEGKAVKYRYVYDKPETPLERLRKADPGNPALERLDRIYRRTNAIAFRRLIVGKIRQVVRRTKAARTCGGGG